MRRELERARVVRRALVNHKAFSSILVIPSAGTQSSYLPRLALVDVHPAQSEESTVRREQGSVSMLRQHTPVPTGLRLGLTVPIINRQHDLAR